MTLIKDSFCFECPVPLHWRARMGLCLLHCRVCYCAVRCRVLLDIKFLHFLFAQPCESAVHKVCIDLHKRPSWQRRVRCLFLTRSDTPWLLFVYCKVAGTKTKVTQRPQTFGGKSACNYRSWCPHSGAGFFGSPGFRRKIDTTVSKFSSWNHGCGFTAIPLWIPMDFLSIPMDSFGFQAMKLKERIAEKLFRHVTVSCDAAIYETAG